MSLFEMVFGVRPDRSPRKRENLPVIEDAPEGADWHYVHPRVRKGAVHAWLAVDDCRVATEHGVLTARGGKDVIVEYGPEDSAVVRRDIFDRTYEALGDGRYRKRTDVTFRYFTLDHPVLVDTLEGLQRAAAGDWIVEGLDGELWPIAPSKAAKKYKAA